MWCYIIDYTYGAIYEHKMTKEEEDMDGDDLIEKLDFSTNNCYILTSQERIQIESLDNN